MWFGKMIPLDVIEDFLTSFIRRKRNTQFIKINIHPNMLENIEYIKKNNKIVPILKYNGIIINKNQFKTEWELIDFIKEEDYDDGYDLNNENNIDYSDNESNLMNLIHDNIHNEEFDLNEPPNLVETDTENVEENVEEENVEEEDVEEEDVEEENVEEENVEEENVEDENKTIILDEFNSVKKLKQKATHKRKKKKIIKTHTRKIIFS